MFVPAGPLSIKYVLLVSVGTSAIQHCFVFLCGLLQLSNVCFVPVVPSAVMSCLFVSAWHSAIKHCLIAPVWHSASKLCLFVPVGPTAAKHCLFVTDGSSIDCVQ